MDKHELLITEQVSVFVTELTQEENEKLKDQTIIWEDKQFQKSILDSIKIELPDICTKFPNVICFVTFI